ncbi:MAG: porin family protein [Dysgonamonadaceae bacterium]|jgi:hypothetical protein|nr:porin family protein [Dysgonamonadaceae bacterium]
MKTASEKYTNRLGTLIAVFALLACTTAVAQEYKYEIGGMLGTSMYMGDANETSRLQGMNPAGGLVFRRNFNFRWAFKADLMAGKVSGDTKNTENVFFDNQQAAFNRTFFGLGGQMEFNFLPYSDKFAYLNTSRIAPYITAGLGFTLAPGDGRTFFAMRLPLGIGIKYKIVNRLNLGLEYTINHLFSDSFDSPSKEGFALDNPYGTGYGFLKNNDNCNTLMLSLTWDFGPNDRKCTNE